MASAVRRIQRLFVGNLPWTVGHIELKEFFMQFGHVRSANVMFDKSTGCSKGYGFIEIDDSKVDLVQKLERENRLFLEGSYLAVHPSEVEYRNE